jgi:DNA-binding NtrC family response regulator
MNDPIKILIVDDNEHVRRKIKRILSASNRAFFEAANEEDALTLIKENHFDIIFLDIRLPFGSTGIDVYKKAKEVQPNLGKVIILTGWLEDSTRNEANELGAFAYLDKAPLDRNKIIEAFNKALSQREDR